MYIHVCSYCILYHMMGICIYIYIYMSVCRERDRVQLSHNFWVWLGSSLIGRPGLMALPAIVASPSAGADYAQLEEAAWLGSQGIGPIYPTSIAVATAIGYV